MPKSSNEDVIDRIRKAVKKRGAWIEERLCSKESVAGHVNGTHRFVIRVRESEIVFVTQEGGNDVEGIRSDLAKIAGNDSPACEKVGKTLLRYSWKRSGK